MERFVKGDVVVLPFPFSDLSASKRRPALVAAELTGEDVVLCQITSKTRKDDYALLLKKQDFQQGKLHVDSMIRPNRLFTAEKSIVQYKVGSLKGSKIKEVENKVIEIFTS
tara:strand:- start:60 stop:392 length:333 start_codon:yes stop_codon:yes gene_type:complete